MEQKWTTIIRPYNKLLDLKLNELWQYRDLIIMFVKRDFKTMYNQEIAKRDNLNEKIDKISNKINSNMKISDNQFKKVAKKVTNVKNWSKEQLADVIESVEIDNNDNIYINYKYDILVIA